MKSHRNLKTVVALAVASLSSGFALAGQGVGNGGGAYVCRDLSTGLTNIELVDIWEGRTLYGYKYPEAQSVDTRILSAIGKLTDQALLKVVVSNLGFVRDPKNQPPVPADRALPAPTDVKNRYEKPGLECALKGVARYNDDSNTLEIDRTYFGVMDELNQAALWLHEAVYKAMRSEFQETDSVHARQLTACLLSTAGSCSMIQGVPSLDKKLQDKKISQEAAIVAQSCAREGLEAVGIRASGNDIIPFGRFSEEDDMDIANTIEICVDRRGFSVPALTGTLAILTEKGIEIKFIKFAEGIAQLTSPKYKL